MNKRVIAGFRLQTAERSEIIAARIAASFLLGALVLLLLLSGCQCPSPADTLELHRAVLHDATEIALRETARAYEQLPEVQALRAHQRETAAVEETLSYFAGEEAYCRHDPSSAFCNPVRMAGLRLERQRFCLAHVDACAPAESELPARELTIATPTFTPTLEPLRAEVALPVASTPSPTPTNTPTPLPAEPEIVGAPPPACIAPPDLFDPPDGRTFAALNTVFRWKGTGELGPDLVYDVLVSTDGGKTFTSVGTTRDTNLPIDFLKWNLAGMTGNFTWTVRIRDASGKYVSCEGKWLAMTLTEIKGGVPGVGIEPKRPCTDPNPKMCP